MVHHLVSIFELAFSSALRSFTLPGSAFGREGEEYLDMVRKWNFSFCCISNVPPASWGQGSECGGEDHDLHQCEGRFFRQLASMKRTRGLGVMFEYEGDDVLQDET